MSECPCRYCDKRHATCHGTCEDYKEWSKRNENNRKMVYEKTRLSFLSRDERPKRRHGKR